MEEAGEHLHREGTGRVSDTHAEAWTIQRERDR